MGLERTRSRCPDFQIKEMEPYTRVSFVLFGFRVCVTGQLSFVKNSTLLDISRNKKSLWMAKNLLCI